MQSCDYNLDIIDDDLFDVEEGNFYRNGILYIPVPSLDDDQTPEEFDVPTEQVLMQHPDQVYQQMADQTAKFHYETRSTSFATVARSQLRSHEKPNRQKASDYSQLRLTEPALWNAYEDLYGDNLSQVKRIIQDEIIQRPDSPIVDTTDEYPPLGHSHPQNKKSSKLKHNQLLWRYIYCFLYTSILVCLYINQIPNKYIRL
ncbi:hypothetical protein TRICI_005537 [Trichomonascus ciferrii]|uniref:Uncharacterized protein n=1 Tax=Trichomonascus ciferrii TaxID=44093 RepID=A0A642USF9_9ASCO|nr:hypothetical protein TRICI_005537 [Trichomonascus ciferrii]